MTLCVAAGCLATLACWDSVRAADDASAIGSILKTHCLRCHGGKKTKAGISFASFKDELNVWRDRQIWLRVLNAIKHQEMPPEESRPKLSGAKRDQLKRWVAHTLDDVDVSRIPKDPGHTPPRRLNRAEYRYTVEDLFDINFQPVALPPDQVARDGFDNAAITLSTQPALIEKYIALAIQISDKVWADESARKRLIFAHPPGSRKFDRLLPYIASEAESKKTDMGDGSFTVAVKFKTTEGGTLFSKSPKDGQWVPDAKALFLVDGHLAYDIGWVGQIRSERRYSDGKWHHAVLSVGKGRIALYADGREVADGRMNKKDVASHRFKVGEAGSDEFLPFSGGQIAYVRFFSKAVSAAEAKAMSLGQPVKGKPSFQWDLSSKKDKVKPAKTYTEIGAASAVLDRFLHLAFRRSLYPDEKQRYLDLYKKARSLGDDYETALKLPIKTAMVSPAFLFRIEKVKSQIEPYRIDDWELASRLSYFLTASMPDEQLLELAESGTLSRPAVLKAQVHRLLLDPRSQRFTERFITQWLRIDGLGSTIKPDAQLFPHADAKLLDSMKRETVLFADSVLRGNRSVLDLIDADYTFVDEALAKHYGLKNVRGLQGHRARGDQMMRVTLTDGDRGGLLTQASVLTVSSSPRRTSPVFRGIWILDVLLGEPPPPPPANVPPLQAGDKATPTSLRQKLEQHRADPSCNSCHRRIDPLGFALESFDATGRLRTGPVDNTGQLSDGTKFKGHRGLKKLLAGQKKKAFLRQLSAKLLSYALGRDLEFTDEVALQEMLSALKKNDLKSEAMIMAVVMSYPFQYRKEPPPKAKP